MKYMGMLLGVAIAISPGIADARPSTISDFAACNDEATAVAGGGSTLPSEGERGGAAPPALPLPKERADRSPLAPAPGSPGMRKVLSGPRDPILEGMDAGRAGDRPYVTAYENVCRDAALRDVRPPDLLS
jgi:hypothetical protein